MTLKKERSILPSTKYTPQEVAARGEAIYQDKLRSRVEPTHTGNYLVIDIETGDFEIADDDLLATKRLLAKRPYAVLYGVQVGFPTAYRI